MERSVKLAFSPELYARSSFYRGAFNRLLDSYAKDNSRENTQAMSDIDACSSFYFSSLFPRGFKMSRFVSDALYGWVYKEIIPLTDPRSCTVILETDSDDTVRHVTSQISKLFQQIKPKRQFGLSFVTKGRVISVSVIEAK